MQIFHPLRLRTFLATIGITLVACFTAAVALPHDPYIRYQALSGTIFERARWFYERIHFDETPIDVVFIGASRTARGVIPPALEARLTAKGFDRRIVNFSLPASGFDINLSLAREVLESRDVELMVIAVVEQFPRDGHQAFADLATTGDVMTSPWIVNRNLPRNLAYLPMRQLQLAVATWAPGAFGYRRAFDRADYVGSTIDQRIFNPATNEAPANAEAIAALEKESRFRRRTLTGPVLPKALTGIEFGVSRSYISSIAALAKSHDTRLAFLYLPFYKGFAHPAEQAWLEQYGPVLSAGFLLDDPANYTDAAHVSERGAELVSDWLPGQLIPLLAQDRP